MERYAVVIAYREPEGSHPDRLYEATIEVTARTPAQAKVLATREFKTLTELSWVRGARDIIEDKIAVKSARAHAAALTLDVSEQAPGTLVMRIAGVLDADTDAAFKAKLKELVAAGRRRLIIDLAGLNYINSTSIGEIAALLSSFELRLACIQPGVLRVLKMVGIDRAVPCFGSVELANASF